MSETKDRLVKELKNVVDVEDYVKRLVSRGMHVAKIRDDPKISAAMEAISIESIKFLFALKVLAGLVTLEEGMIEDEYINPKEDKS